MNFADLHIDQSKLDPICRRFHVLRLEGFGSFARGDGQPESDVDILVTFEPGAELGLRIVALKLELEALLGRPVDLLTRSSVESSPNKYFRRFSMRDTEPVYERA